MSDCARGFSVCGRRLSSSAAVANIALVKADKARKIEDLLIMNAQRGAAPCIIAAGLGGDTLAGVIQGKVDETQLKAMLEQINEKTEQKVKVRSANASTFRFVQIYCPGYCCAPHELGRFGRRLICGGS